MKSNRTTSSPTKNAATCVRRSRLVFAFYCVLGFVAATLSNAVAAQAQDANTENIVFFSIPVGVDSAPIYASPSKNTYQTGSIKKDQYVEVYFCNKDGFCAIRPPQGSFSWINSKFVELENATSGKIVSAKAAPSRVGADSPVNSSVVQVGLQNNQKVKILDQVDLSDGSTWYKILPPAGEFRWIALKDLFQDEALAQLPNKLTTRADFESRLQTKGLVQARALENAGTADDDIELTLPNLDEENDGLLGYDPTSSGQAQQTNNASHVNVSVDRSSFEREMERLKMDVTRTLQGRSFSIEDVKVLQLRVEELFDAAPSDSDRHVLQPLYNALKKAEKEAERQLYAQAQSGQSARTTASVVTSQPTSRPQTAKIPPRNNSVPRFPQAVPDRNAQNLVQTPNRVAPQTSRATGAIFGNARQNVQTNAGRPMPKGAASVPNANGVQWVQAFDEQGRMQMLPLDRNGNVVSELASMNASNNVVNAPSVIANQSLGALPQGYASAPKTNKKNTDKNKKTFAFAFSEENSPFRSKTKETRISDDAGSQNDANLSRLPSLLPSAQVIVPPQDYDMGVSSDRPRLNSKLAAQTPNVLPKAAASETPVQETQIAQAPTPAPTRRSQGTLVFQAPKIDGVSEAKTQNVQEPNDNKILPASSNAPKVNGDSPNKIRQTSGFTPVTVRTKEGFDAKGTLIAISPAGDGAPRFALLDSSGGEFNIHAYLQPGKGVVLERFVGSHVGVKGNIGTIGVNGKTYKLVVVNSIFPQ